VYKIYIQNISKIYEKYKIYTNIELDNYYQWLKKYIILEKKKKKQVYKNTIYI
jgi:hypothetical protein